MNENDHVVVLLGHAASEFVRVEILGRAFPSSSDYWDANWLVADVKVRVGGFDGRARLDIRADELAQFGDDVRRLYRELRGEALLEPMEGGLSIKLVGDGVGHIAAQGVLLDNPNDGNRLEFTLRLDQTELPGALNGLDEACREYPVRGSP